MFSSRWDSNPPETHRLAAGGLQALQLGLFGVDSRLGARLLLRCSLPLRFQFGFNLFLQHLAIRASASAKAKRKPSCAIHGVRLLLLLGLSSASSSASTCSFSTSQG